MPLIVAVSVAGSLAILATVVWLTASGRLKPRYALLWLLASVALVVVSAWHEVIDVVGAAFGVDYKPSLLFLGVDVFLMVILLHMSVVVSRLTDRTRRLSQEIALLRERAEGRRELEDPPAPK